tara:strand:+ start:657 stop:1355 length:699 start_codon:yes stop_codon:yes gene_type:complete
MGDGWQHKDDVPWQFGNDQPKKNLPPLPPRWKVMRGAPARLKWRLDTGEVPFTITHTNGVRVKVLYESGIMNEYPVSRLVSLPTISPSEGINNLNEDKTMTNEKTLYEIQTAMTSVDGTLTNHKTLYGNKLAVNSAGLWVMEVKGTGEIITAKASDVSEVVPYSVGITFIKSGTVYHYFANVGDFAKGDVVVLNDSFATVVKLDCKSKQASKWLNCFKLQGVAVTYPQEGNE